jgi:hypothetical protein
LWLFVGQREESFLFVLRVSSDALVFAMNVGSNVIGTPIRFVLRAGER